MKNQFIFCCLLSLIVLGEIGCKPESPALFSQPASLYFGTPDVYNPSFTSATQFSFAQYPHRTVDTFMVKVSLLGNVSSADRSFTVSTVDTATTNATAGQDFQLMPSYTLPAGATSVNIPVILYRSPKLDSTAINFFLKVDPNKDFAPASGIQGIFNIQVSYLQKPATWDATSTGVVGWAKYQTNFGTWTKTKYLVILNALYNPLGDTSVAFFPYPYQASQVPPIETQYLQIVKNYIKKNYPGNYSSPLGVGPTLTDPDANNAVIQVGPSNY